MNNKKRFLSDCVPRRVVIKVGTSSLTHPSGLISIEKVENIVRQLIDLKHKGSEVILVSSGAIGAGMGQLGVDKNQISLAQKQALAAVGQNILMHIYHKFAAEYGSAVGQVLLTREDIDNPARCHYSHNAFTALLDFGVIPIVNENDAVAVEEIKFGDNDQLSAMVAKLVGADWLVILTDIDGLYDYHPSNPQAKLIAHVENLCIDHFDVSTGSTSGLGTGGMQTKLAAVAIAQTAGIQTIIANSQEKNIITRLFKGEQLGTWFECKGDNCG